MPEKTEVSDEREGLPSASGLERIALCPGSWNLEKDLPPLPEEKPSLSGTKIHAALAGDEAAFDAMDDDEREVFGRCKEQHLFLLETLGIDPGDAVSYHEVRERLYLQGVPIMSGKADIATMAINVGLLTDAKTGRGEVTPSVRNLQLRSLAVIFSEAFGLNFVVTGILQPWVSNKPKYCEYDEKALAEAKKEIVYYLSRAKDPQAPRNPGPIQCKYCRAQAICPEAQKYATALVKIKVGELTGEQISTVLDQLDVAKLIIKGIETRAKEMLTVDPASIPGWKLEPGDTRRSIKNASDAFKLLAKEGLISAEAFVECCDVKIGELEKTVADFSGMKKKDAKVRVNQVLETCIESKQNRPSLTKEEK